MTSLSTYSDKITICWQKIYNFKNPKLRSTGDAKSPVTVTNSADNEMAGSIDGAIQGDSEIELGRLSKGNLENVNGEGKTEV